MKINLNKVNGDVAIGDLEITSMFSIAAIENLKDKYNMIFVMTNDNGYSLYRTSFLDGGEISALFMFKNNKIRSLNIGVGFNYNFPPYIVTDEQRTLIKDLILSIGGARQYPWGSVSYNDDNKGGSVGVFVAYNNEN
jgi:hypothetical protein